MDTECSERQERPTAFVACELCQYNVDIPVLQETRRTGEGHLTDKGAGWDSTLDQMCGTPAGDNKHPLPPGEQK